MDNRSRHRPRASSGQRPSTPIRGSGHAQASGPCAPNRLGISAHASWHVRACVASAAASAGQVQAAGPA